MNDALWDAARRNCDHFNLTIMLELSSNGVRTYDFV